MFFFDPTYLVFILPGLALSLWASFRTKSAFRKGIIPLTNPGRALLAPLLLFRPLLRCQNLASRNPHESTQRLFRR